MRVIECVKTFRRNHAPHLRYAARCPRIWPCEKAFESSAPRAFGRRWRSSQQRERCARGTDRNTRGTDRTRRRSSPRRTIASTFRFNLFDGSFDKHRCAALTATRAALTAHRDVHLLGARSPSTFRFSLFDESFDKHRSLLTCGRALAAAWRPHLRPRGGRVAAAAAALASLALTVTAHSLLISTFFFPKGYLTRSAMSGWGKNDPTNKQTNRQIKGLRPVTPT